MHNTRKKIYIYIEKFPEVHHELKISCDRPVAWSGGFSCSENENKIRQFSIFST